MEYRERIKQMGNMEDFSWYTIKLIVYIIKNLKRLYLAN